MSFINWLIAHGGRDVSCGYVPMLFHPLIRKLGEEKQVNVFGKEKEIRLGEMEDSQSSLHCLCHRGRHATFWTAFS